MLRTSEIQNGVTDGNEEIRGLAAKLSGEWGFAQVFDDVVAH